MENIAMM